MSPDLEHRAEEIFNVTTAEPITGNVDGSGPASPTLSRDSRWLGFVDGTGLHVINVQTGERHGNPLQPDNKVRMDAVAFTPDGNRVATGERDSTAAPLVSAHLRFWDTTTALACGRPIPAMALFLFTGARFSPDSRTLFVPTLSVMPGTRDRFTPALQAWPLPVPEMPLADLQRRTESMTGTRLDAGNVVAADPGKPRIP